MRKRGEFQPADGSDMEAIYDHIGEKQDFDENGTCGEGYLVPNRNRTYCTLAARLDVGRHHVMSGGPGKGTKTRAWLRNKCFETLVRKLFSS